MSILITGGAGYTGSHTVRYLTKKGLLPIVIDNLCEGKKETLPPNVPFYEGEIQDSNFISQICKKHKIDSVIHFAAHLKVTESVTNTLKYYQNNIVNSVKFLETVYNEKVNNFVFSSSCAVYGQCESPVIEESSLQPCSPYGHSKLMLEQILRDLSEQSLLTKNPPFNFISLRYFNAAGASLDQTLGPLKDKYSLLIDIACQAAIKNIALEVYGTDNLTIDNSCVRDFVHVDDIARANFLSLEYLKKNKENQILNCGSGQGHSIKTVLNILEKISLKKINTITKPRRPGEAAIAQANIQKIKQVLNWSPQQSNIETICQSAWNWHNRKR